MDTFLLVYARGGSKIPLECLSPLQFHYPLHHVAHCVFSYFLVFTLLLLFTVNHSFHFRLRSKVPLYISFVNLAKSFFDHSQWVSVGSIYLSVPWLLYFSYQQAVGGSRCCRWRGRGLLSPRERVRRPDGPAWLGMPSAVDRGALVHARLVGRYVLPACVSCLTSA
jgi:hypothetical protein